MDPKLWLPPCACHLKRPPNFPPYLLQSWGLWHLCWIVAVLGHLVPDESWPHLLYGLCLAHLRPRQLVLSGVTAALSVWLCRPTEYLSPRCCLKGGLLCGSSFTRFVTPSHSLCPVWIHRPSAPAAQLCSSHSCCSQPGPLSGHSEAAGWAPSGSVRIKITSYHKA